MCLYFFICFKLSLLCSSMLHLVDQKCSKNSNTEFSAAITPAFNVTWSLRKHSKMLIYVDKSFAA